jgi:sulfate/thiosulfate transport system substrate-binding protein
MRGKIVVLAALTACGAAAVWWRANSDAGTADSVELLNVSYDPTRELWRDLNALFIPRYEQQAAKHLVIQQSHGGSGSQARAVIDGLEADVVTLALWSDTDAIRKSGLLAPDWEKRLPNRSLPYLSTIVFVVRKGNPRGIHDWPDLVQAGVEVITPSPKTSGNGKLSFLAAWGSVRTAGGSEKEAEEFVAQLYRRISVLDPAARGATLTFAHKKIGDVHLTWENEAHLEVAESGGALEIVYPRRSIRAEPHVAVVDAVVDRKGTRAAAEAYLQFLYTEEAQEAFARHHYRPTNAAVLHKHAGEFPAVELFPVTAVAASWEEAQQKFFAEGGVFDRIYQPGH